MHSICSQCDPCGMPPCSKSSSSEFLSSTPNLKTVCLMLDKRFRNVAVTFSNISMLLLISLTCYDLVMTWIGLVLLFFFYREDLHVTYMKSHRFLWIKTAILHLYFCICSYYLNTLLPHNIAICFHSVWQGCSWMQRLQRKLPKCPGNVKKSEGYRGRCSQLTFPVDCSPVIFLSYSPYTITQWVSIQFSSRC